MVCGIDGIGPEDSVGSEPGLDEVGPAVLEGGFEGLEGFVGEGGCDFNALPTVFGAVGMSF